MIVQLLALGSQAGPRYTYNMAVFRHQESVAAFAVFAVLERKSEVTMEDPLATMEEPFEGYKLDVQWEDREPTAAALYLQTSPPDISGVEPCVPATRVSVIEEEGAEWHVFLVGTEETALLMDNMLWGDWNISEGDQELWRAWENRRAEPERGDRLLVDGRLVEQCARRALMNEIGRFRTKKQSGIRVTVMCNVLVSATKYYGLGREAWLAAIPRVGEYLIDRGQAWCLWENAWCLWENEVAEPILTPGDGVVYKYRQRVVSVEHDVASKEVRVWLRPYLDFWTDRDVGQSDESFIETWFPGFRVIGGPFSAPQKTSPAS